MHTIMHVVRASILWYFCQACCTEQNIKQHCDECIPASKQSPPALVHLLSRLDGMLYRQLLLMVWYSQGYDHTEVEGGNHKDEGEECIDEVTWNNRGSRRHKHRCVKHQPEMRCKETR